MTFNVQNFIFGSADKFSCNPKPLPLPVWMAIQGVSYFEHTWYWLKRGEMISKSENHVPLLTGLILTFVFKNVDHLNYLGRVLDFALRIIECIKDVSRIKTDYYRLKDLILGNEKLITKLKWKNQTRAPYFFTLLFYEKTECFYKRMVLISKILKNLVSNTLTFSVHVLEAKMAYEGHLLSGVEVILNASILAREAPLIDEILVTMARVKGVEIKWRTKDFLEAAKFGTNKSEQEVMNEVNKKFYLSILHPSRITKTVENQKRPKGFSDILLSVLYMDGFTESPELVLQPITYEETEYLFLKC